jgi:MOSC domain-containing protein YiiM
MPQTIAIQSVNISGLAPLVPGVKRTRTGIHKQPVSAPIAVTTLGLEGDRVGNTTHHGGPDQAVYLYSAEDYAWWRTQLGSPCSPGLFGDNLTIDRWWPDPRIGDRLTIGDVTLELTAPRIPCNTLATRMEDPGFVKRFADAGRPGAYARVIQTGVIAAGTTGIVQPSIHPWPTIAELNVLWLRKSRDASALRAMLAAPVAARYREKLLLWAGSAT